MIFIETNEAKYLDIKKPLFRGAFRKQIRFAAKPAWFSATRRYTPANQRLPLN